MATTANHITEQGETVTYTGGREGIRFATWGRLQGEWVHFGWSSAADAVKATGAARSTNPYATEYGATSVNADGVTPVAFIKANSQIGNKARRRFR